MTNAPALHNAKWGRCIVIEFYSEQSADDAVVVHVDVLRRGDLGQTRHGEDVPGEYDDEARAGGDLHLPHGHGEILRCAQ